MGTDIRQVIVYTSPDSFREALHLSRRLAKENTRNPDSAVYVGPHIPSQIQLATCYHLNPVPAPLLHEIWSKEVAEAIAMRLMVAENTDKGGVGSDAVIAFNHCAVEHLDTLTSLSILECGVSSILARRHGVSLILHLVLDTMLQINNALTCQVFRCQRSSSSLLRNCNLMGQFVRTMVLL